MAKKTWLVFGCALSVAATACAGSAKEPGGDSTSALLAGAPASAIGAASAAAAGGPYDPERALAYTPGDSPTDRVLAASLAQLRAKPASADPYVNAAVLFVRRARETQSPEIYRLADDVIRAALSRAPDDARALSLRALVLQQNHHFVEARDLGRRITEAHPDDTTGHLVYGDALLELGDVEAAAAAFQRAVDLRPDLRTYNRGAYVRWLSGDVDGAVELYRLALDAGSVRDPESLAWCWSDLAELYFQRNALGESLTASQRALDLVADYVPALRVKARVLAVQGQRDDARRLLERAVQRRGLVEDLLALSELTRALGRHADAERLLAEARRTGQREDPRSLALHLARYDVEHAAAVALAARELTARKNVYSWDASAFALCRDGKLVEARTAMNHALSLGTPDARFFLHDALLKLAEGDVAGARVAFAHAQSLQPLADPVLAAELTRRLASPSGEGR